MIFFRRFSTFHRCTLPLFILSAVWVLISVTAPFLDAGEAPAAADRFQVECVQQQTIDDTDCIAVVFSQALNSRKNINPYLSITREDGSPVAGAWAMTTDAVRAYFTNIEPGTKYVVEIQKGLLAKNGKRLEKNARYELSTREVLPMIGFGNSGHILPRSKECVLPVDTMNIDRADIDFFRIRPEKIHLFRQHFARQKKLYYHESRDLSKISDLVYSGRWDLDIKKNLRTRVNLPISHIRELAAPGLYLAVIRGAGVYDYGYSSLFFSVSDIGIQARMYKNSMQIITQSIRDGHFLSKIFVEGFDAKGNLVFEGTTGKKGIFQYTGNTESLSLISARDSKENHGKRNTGQMTFLPVDTPALDLSLFHTGKRNFQPVEFFVFGPRNLYRPGETLVLDALLRDHDGNMTRPLPIEVEIFTPDGRLAGEFIWKGDDLGHYSRKYALSPNALTGQWQAVFSAAGTELSRYHFLVAEFLPERMDLDIGNPRGEGQGKDDGEPQGDVILRHQDLAVAARGQYLYGAAAENCRVDAVIEISAQRELFRDKWPGFEFGNKNNLLNQTFSSPEIFLDEQGKGILDIDRQWEEISSPHRITANVSLYDDSGKPVSRSRFWQVWPAPALAGIYCAEKEGTVPEDSVVDFQMIVVDKNGDLVPAQGLEVRLIREIREYFWEFSNEHWQWKWSSRFVTEESRTIDVEEKHPASVSFPVEYGPYRLDVIHPESGLVSSREIYAGWQPEGSSGGNLNRPDRVDLILDKKAYAAGDTVHLTLRSPQRGTGYVFVEADTCLAAIPVEVSGKDQTISFVVQPEWDRHDIHVSAVIVHPHSRSGFSGHSARPAKDKKLPKRSVGLVPLPLEREHRKLGLDIQLPKKMMPGQKIRVPVQVTWANGNRAKLPEEVYVGLAAVDMGLLNLTGFETPDPFGYFFEGRQYGVEIHDMYQKLLLPNEGGLGSPRFGGDTPYLARGGQRPAADVRIVALDCAPVRADASGMAYFEPVIPDFNGKLRFMAFAWTKDSLGSSEQEVTFASPLVTTMTMPRFLAMGDEANFFLGLHNLTDIDQNISADLVSDGPVALVSETSMQIHLEPGQRKTIGVKVHAQGAVGRSRISCRLDGIRVPEANGRKTKNIDLSPSWFIDTRSAWPAMTDHIRTSIAPGKSLVLPGENFQGTVPETLSVKGEISLLPSLNPAAHIRELAAYPYGCLEQVTSALFPHVILSKKDFEKMGIESRVETNAEETSGGTKTRDVMAAGLQKILERQKSSGGFALWEATDREEPWLTAYAGHFLLEAFQAGHDPGKTAMDKLARRLVTYLRNPGVIAAPYHVDAKSYKAISQAYAAYVLARMKSLTLGDARSFYKREERHIAPPLGHVHAAMALYLAGDKDMADDALKNAFSASRNVKKKSSQSGQYQDQEQWFGDYGSALRDDAMAFYLVGQHYPSFPGLKIWLQHLDKKLDSTQWFSTQERNALVMAGAQLASMKTETWQANVDADGKTMTMRNNRALSFNFFGKQAANGMEIQNPGDKELFVNLDITGSPREKPGMEQRRARIKKRFLDMNGNPLSGNTFRVGDRVIVELQFMGEVPLHNGLVVDLLPAGFELEDPGLPNSPDIGKIMVNKKSIAQWQTHVNIIHTEFRDDRFAAAVSTGAKQWNRLYYLMRATGEGSFLNPVVLLEDMYNPAVRAVGNNGGGAEERILVIP